MSERSFTEGELTQWLETTGITPRPDYVDDLLTQTARSRQRSAWRFPERWLPMDLTARAPTITGRQVPLRLIGLVALVVLALVVGTTLFVASQRRLPAPFGPAANGLIVYAAPTDPSWMDTRDYQRPIGDILTANPVTGASSTLVGGPTVDGYPVVSLDGTRVAFVREDRARPDALRRGHSGRRPSAADAGAPPGNRRRCLVAGWPDIAFAAREGDLSNLWIRDQTAARPTRSISGRDLSVVLPQWRPPDGEELLVSGRRPRRTDSFRRSGTAVLTAPQMSRPGREHRSLRRQSDGSGFGRSPGNGTGL